MSRRESCRDEWTAWGLEADIVGGRMGRKAGGRHHNGQEEGVKPPFKGSWMEGAGLSTPESVGMPAGSWAAWGEGAWFVALGDGGRSASGTKGFRGFRGCVPSGM